MSLDSYAGPEFSYAQSHLLILSGLYGALRGMDLMQAYRLEMKSKTPDGLDRLDANWRDLLTSWINSTYGKTEGFVLQLASKEYMRAIDESALLLPVVTVRFEQKRHGAWKTHGLLVKRARGKMIDFCITRKVDDKEMLDVFNDFDYSLFSNTDSEMVFRSKSH